jgi:predicted nucleic acid-binding Zn ribbon protein
MPTYVYRFVDTGETIEVQQSFADDALTEAAHPATGVVMPVKKVFTPVGVTFKGGGFYRTDSRSSSRSSSKASSSSDKSEGSKSSDSTSSDSKTSDSKSSESSSSSSKASASSDG